MIKWLSQLSIENSEEFGNKGAVLGFFMKKSPREFQIPNGFVISSRAMEKFFMKNGILEEVERTLPGINADSPENLKAAANRIQELILNREFDQDFANKVVDFYSKIRLNEELRASHKAQEIVGGSEAETVVVRASTNHLNLCDVFSGVKGSEQLLNSIKRIYSSYYSPENIFYRIKKNLNQKFCSVLIQRIVRAEKSGTAVMHQNYMIVDGAYGLGTLTSEGENLSDFYAVDMETGKIEGRIAQKEIAEFCDELGNVSMARVDYENRNKQVFSDYEISSIFKLLSYVKSETGLNGIEFCINKSRLTLLNAFKEDFGNCFERRENSTLNGLGFGNALGMAGEIGSENYEILLSKKAAKDLIIYPSKGIVCDLGSISSKLFRAAKSLEIPTVVGTEEGASLKNKFVEIFGNSLLATEKPMRQEQKEISFSNTATDIFIIGTEIIRGASGIILDSPVNDETLSKLSNFYTAVWIHEENPPYFNFPREQGTETQSVMVLKNVKTSEPGMKKAPILQNYSQILSFEGSENLDTIFLRADSLSYDLKAFANSIKRLSQVFPSARICIIVESLNPEVIKEGIYAGADAVAVKKENFDLAEKLISKIEMKFVLDKLRKLERLTI